MKFPDDYINKIIQGDCLEIMKDIPAGSVDLINADPPYNFDNNAGVNGEYSKSSYLRKHQKEYLKQIDKRFGHDFQPEEYLEASVPIMKKYNAYWWTSKNLVHRYINWAVDHKFSFNILTWHKLNPLPLWNNNYVPDTEYCIFLRQKGAYFNSKLTNWQKYRKFYITNNRGHNSDHPAVKPLFIIKVQIEVSSLEGALVLDPFVGSGTMAVASKELRRQFIGIDLNPISVKLARKRLSQKGFDFSYGSYDEKKDA